MNGGGSYVPGVHDDRSLIAAGAISATGLAVLLIKNSCGNTDAKLPAPTMQTEGGRHGSPANRTTS
jgi:hypothetical protein